MGIRDYLPTWLGGNPEPAPATSADPGRRIDLDRWTCPKCGNPGNGAAVAICPRCGGRRPTDTTAQFAPWVAPTVVVLVTITVFVASGFNPFAGAGAKTATATALVAVGVMGIPGEVEAAPPPDAAPQEPKGGEVTGRVPSRPETSVQHQDPTYDPGYVDPGYDPGHSDPGYDPGHSDPGHSDPGYDPGHSDPQPPDPAPGDYPADEGDE